MRPGPAGRNPKRSRPWAARMTSAFRRAPRVPFRTDEKNPKVRLRTLHLGRPARAAPGARYARRPLAGAPPRVPGLSPLRGPGPVGRILYKDGLRPNPLDPRAASGWPSAKVGGAPSTDERTGVQHPASRRAAGAMPLPASLRNRTGNASGETRVSHHAHFRSAAHGRRSFLAGLLFPCWERPQPELSPQLAYSWGAVVTGGYWQGTPGGFSRGLAEVPLSVLLWVLSLTQRKYPARRGGTRQSPAAEGGSSQPSEGGR